ncbi:(2Fe-2S)-binding protein [Candidatus Bipolaricaulota bacterium]|nr:(2Fe-2S)-binding protein [Candidatus Bipolaricaulota bacterium]
MPTISLMVNGDRETADVAVSLTLLEFLRDRLALTGTKEGCGIGECGACTVLFDGLPVTSCLVLAVEADGHEIKTIEGESVDGTLSILQQAFMDAGAVQCGFCTPGMILSARALLSRTPTPTREEIVESIAGNLCRCTGYDAIINAISLAAERVRGERKAPNVR